MQTLKARFEEDSRDRLAGVTLIDFSANGQNAGQSRLSLASVLVVRTVHVLSTICYSKRIAQTRRLFQLLRRSNPAEGTTGGVLSQPDRPSAFLQNGEGRKMRVHRCRNREIEALRAIQNKKPLARHAIRSMPSLTSFQCPSRMKPASVHSLL